MDVVKLQDRLAAFANDRDWEQYHSPKNLAMALSVEAAELLEIFQWLTEEESRNVTSSEAAHKRIEEEIGDIGIYLLRLCDKLDIDLEEAIRGKLEINAEKYPVELARGNATKYNQRDE